MVAIMDCECFLSYLYYISADFDLCSCENVVLWRGHFQSTGVEKSVNLSINGGEGVMESLLTHALPTDHCTLS